MEIGSWLRYNFADDGNNYDNGQREPSLYAKAKLAIFEGVGLNTGR